MRRLRTVCVVGLLALLTACGSAGPSDSPAPPAGTVAPKAAPLSDAERREAIYLDQTAAHLCAVQSRVYTDPGEMASAYASEPRYTGLTPEEVAAFDERAKSDAEFATRLSETITATCARSTPSNSAAP